MKEKYKILVVNGDEELLNEIEKEKEAGTYATETAQTAALALEKVKRDKYHIILIDIDLPDMNGIELLEEIKAYDSLAQVIVTAKDSTMEKIFSALESGANDFLADPLHNFEELKNMINYSAEKLERWRKSIVDLVK